MQTRSSSHSCAILYYFTMLFAEVAILYNEENKRKQLERASRSRDGRSPKQLNGSKSAGRLVDSTSGEINTGSVDQQTNPLFISGSDGSAGALSVTRENSQQAGQVALDAVADTVQSYASPPPPEVWPFVQVEVLALAQKLQAREQFIRELQAANAASGAEDVRSSVALDGGKRKTFAPVTSGVSASPSGKALVMAAGNSRR